MKGLNIVGKYMDEREFRNYVHTMFPKHNITILDRKVLEEGIYEE